MTSKKSSDYLFNSILASIMVAKNYLMNLVLFIISTSNLSGNTLDALSPNINYFNNTYALVFYKWAIS